MSEYSILEWNINQATNHSGNNNIPNFVFEEIRASNADIVTLLEFSYSCKNAQDFIKRMEEMGYQVKYTDNKKETNQNDVLIAWKDDKFRLEDSSKNVFGPYPKENIPEMLAVKLDATEGNIPIVIIGVRIKLFLFHNSKEESWKKRKEQLTKMLEYIKDFYTEENTIIVGDFNNNRVDLDKCNDDSFVDLWSITVIDNLIKNYGLRRYTPDNMASIKQQNSIFKNDHLIISNTIKVLSKKYSRGFTNKNSDIYLHGQDFEVYNRRLKQTTWSIPYGSGIPDHAILQCRFEL